MAMLVEMVSDLVCPWCWLGLRRTVAAVNALDDPSRIALRFRPFQLDSSIPAEGVAYKDYMTSKFGEDGENAEARGRWSAMREALEGYGADEDIPFRFSGIPMRPNTFNSHRLVRWAQGQGLGAKAKEVLFDAYFNRHSVIGDTAVLTKLAVEIGLHADVIETLLSRDDDKTEIMQEETFFRQMGISGVPTLIIDRKYAVQGAQESDKIVRALNTALSEGPQTEAEPA